MSILLTIVLPKVSTAKISDELLLKKIFFKIKRINVLLELFSFRLDTFQYALRTFGEV